MAIYNKDEMTDLSPAEKKALKFAIDDENKVRAQAKVKSIKKRK